MTGADIINEILAELKIKASIFSKSLGYERPQKIYDIQKGKTKNISNELADDIVFTYPQFNKSWVLTGEGPMLKSGGGGYSISIGDYNRDMLIGGHNSTVVRESSAPYGIPKNTEEVQELYEDYKDLIMKYQLLKKEMEMKDHIIAMNNKEIENLSKTIEKRDAIIDKLLSQK